MTPEPNIVARPCRECHGYGRRRAQLVLTVGNFDTGAVASASVVPGSVPPAVTPDGTGWRIALGPVLADLAARVDAAPPTLREVFTPERPPDPDGELTIPLPYDWRPDLPVEHRHRIEAAALVNRSYAPWLVVLGHYAALPGDVPTLAGLVRLVNGLGLAVQVTVADHRHNANDPRLALGTRWQVEIVDPEAALGPADPPPWRTLPEAIGHCLRGLGPALLATVPVDPDRPMRVPQQAAPPAGAPDPADHLWRLAARHPGEPVIARFEPRRDRRPRP
ncbi:hypothetical protein [Plantactinospora sp. B24E8]|uniref:hypothetical protein n=1 Tax=Plantactinospora sp. B24E8 TaxID=3153567 RepID=UPI00325DC893